MVAALTGVEPTSTPLKAMLTNSHIPANRTQAAEESTRCFGYFSDASEMTRK